jgi:hypothetical protein
MTTLTPVADLVISPADSHGLLRLDRRKTLACLADGGWPESVFGPERASVARQITGFIRGVQLDKEELLTHALRPTRQLERRYAAYRNGVRYLREAYWSYFDPEEWAA